MPVIPGYSMGGYQNIGNNILQLKEAAARNSVARQELKAREKARMLDAVMNMGNNLREDARYKQGMDYRKQMDAVGAHDKMREERIRREDAEKERQRLMDESSADNARADAYLDLAKINTGENQADRQAKRMQELAGTGMGMLQRLPGIGQMFQSPEDRAKREQSQFGRMLDISKLNLDARRVAADERRGQNDGGIDPFKLEAARRAAFADDWDLNNLLQQKATAREAKDEETVNRINGLIRQREAELEQDLSGRVGGIQSAQPGMSGRSDMTGISRQPWEAGVQPPRMPSPSASMTPESAGPVETVSRSEIEQAMEEAALVGDKEMVVALQRSLDEMTARIAENESEQGRQRDISDVMQSRGQKPSAFSENLNWAFPENTVNIKTLSQQLSKPHPSPIVGRGDVTVPGVSMGMPWAEAKVLLENALRRMIEENYERSGRIRGVR